MSWGLLPWVYPVWDSLGFLDLGDYFLPHFREVFNYYLLKYFLMVFLSSSSGTPMIRMLGHLTLFQRSLRLSSFLLIHFPFFLCFIYFYHSIFYLTYPIFCLCYSTVCFLCWEDPLEKEMATHSSILAWRIPATMHTPDFTGLNLLFPHVTVFYFEKVQCFKSKPSTS